MKGLNYLPILFFLFSSFISVPFVFFSLNLTQHCAISLQVYPQIVKATFKTEKNKKKCFSYVDLHKKGRRQPKPDSQRTNSSRQGFKAGDTCGISMQWWLVQPKFSNYSYCCLFLNRKDTKWELLSEEKRSKNKEKICFQAKAELVEKEFRIFLIVKIKDYI